MKDPTAACLSPRPPDCNAALVLADGTVFWGRGIGAAGQAVGEVCFNTAMTGYQEILTDPSYAGQIITFTFPHIGNVGANREDIETTTPAARGLVVRETPTAAVQLPRRAAARCVAASRTTSSGLCGVDTRRLTRRIRDRRRARTGSSRIPPDGQADIADDARGGAGLAGARRHGPRQGGQLPAEL